MEKLTSYLEVLIAHAGMSPNLAAITTHVLMTLFVLLVAWGSFFVCHKLLVPLMVQITKKTEVEWDDILLNEKTLLSASRIVPSIVVWLTLPPVFKLHPVIAEIISRTAAVCIVLTSLRLAIAFIDSFKQLEGEHRTATQQYFHTFCGVIKIILIFISLIIIASVVIDRSPMTLLAGLGATSAILMLVFKDTVTGLVAGIRLTSNNMLHKGDWITVPKAGANGFVQDISLTTVKVRNFDNTIVTVSPRTLVDESFQSWVGMWKGDGRRVARRVMFDFRSITLASDELKKSIADKGYLKEDEMSGNMVNMTLFRRYIERWLTTRDDVNANMLFMVRQLEPSDTGLPVEFYFFLKQKQWKPYEHHLAEVMEYIYAVIPDFGLKIYQRLCQD